MSSTDWRIGYKPDHGAPLEALDDAELISVHHAILDELERRARALDTTRPRQFQLVLEQRELDGRSWWVPLVQYAHTLEQAVDNVLSSSIGELTGGARWVEAWVIPDEHVARFPLERVPRPWFQRSSQ